MNDKAKPAPKRAKAATPAASRPAPAKKPEPSEPAAEPRQPRINEKARQRTRNKLLRAARSVMGRKGIEATAINDITEEAELSFGSFYNYFTSKEEVARAVFIEDALAMIEELDAGTAPEASIAERVGVNIRRTIHRGLTDPVWGWFLVHSMYSINDMISTMGNPLARDIQIGNNEGAFDVVDVDSTVDCIVGGMLFLLRKILEGGRPVSAVESMVQYILRGMGVAHVEVDRIIHIDLGN
ncbi:transcriptional regulator, TetR family [Pseudomonas vancouverensis]|uniref:TetR family transcriptional regulator n=2 Tax=Pseudomonas vancouverensis TaxID=95300 RepID=A0A1H2NMK3_PSEVA|nr:TetR family transcriptional regulator [Pseudomonas vancouverensis]TDB57110.1 TetR family transcriptional regulator [Pseudomonas vancouverensis]SDV06682.1 transcriptional regulator, TetR family [Pseudomonas vancouverensis]